MADQKTDISFKTIHLGSLLHEAFVGVGNSRINPRFHSTEVGGNLGLTRKSPIPAIGLYVRISAV